MHWRRSARSSGAALGAPDEAAKSAEGSLLLPPQNSDSFQEDSAVTDRTNAYFLQVVLRKARENPLANLVLAECRLISFEAKPPQPISDVHGLRREGAVLARRFVEHGECGSMPCSSTSQPSMSAEP